MLLHLPLIFWTSALHRGNRPYTSLVRRLQPAEIVEVPVSAAPICVTAMVGTRRLHWRQYGGRFVRPILRPDGTIASVKDVVTASTEELVGSLKSAGGVWWEDHPSSRDVTLRALDIQYALRVAEEGDFWQEDRGTRRQYHEHLSSVAAQARITNAMVSIAGRLHREGPLPGWVVTLDNDRAAVSRWIWPVVSPTAGPAFFYPGHLEQAARQLVAMENDEPASAPEGKFRYFESSEASHASTLRSVAFCCWRDLLMPRMDTSSEFRSVPSLALKALADGSEAVAHALRVTAQILQSCQSEYQRWGRMLSHRSKAVEDAENDLDALGDTPPSGSP